MPNLSIGLISAPRSENLLQQTLNSMRGAGFEHPIQVFAEPGTEAPAHVTGVSLAYNKAKLGNVANWLAAAQQLRVCDSEFLLICEDDFTLCRSAWEKLNEILKKEGHKDDFGLASLYTPTRNVIGQPDRELLNGWVDIDLGPRGWGAQALCFSQHSLSEYMCSPEAVFIGPPIEYIDITLYACFQRLGLRTFFHCPSLARHDGRTCSTIGHPNFEQFDAVDFDPDY